jgi:hypothetical protein
MNTNTKQRCNAEIAEVQPIPTNRTGHWVREQPFNSIDQWTSVLTSPILWLRATKNIKKGEEIFASYPLPNGVQRIKASLPNTATSNTHFLEGTIALEGDDTVTSLSPTDQSEPSDYSGGELTDETFTDQHSTQSSPLHQVEPIAHPQHQVLSPDLDASEYTIPL